MQSTYYLFNVVVFLPVLVLSLLSDVKPYQRWRRLLLGFFCVSLPFIIWDAWAASAGHWGFSSDYVTAFRIGNLPVEEILFFITVPYACLYVWGVIGKHYKTTKNVSDIVLRVVLMLSSLVTVLLLFLYWGNGYTRSAILAFLITLAVLSMRKDLVQRRQFWVFEVAVLGLFLLANTFLTALPVITYGAQSIIGFRIGTIPLEDFFFNFALINLWLVVYEKPERFTN